MSALEVDRSSKKHDDLEHSLRCDSRNISSEVIERNLRIISSITLEQLDLIEQDLEMYEKVSLCFLLYGHGYGEVALQKLQISIQIVNSSRNVYMLADWVRAISRNQYMIDNWRDLLIEALCISQINHVLLKLGLDLDELNSRFFPTNPDVNLFVHPVLKCLYLLSEQLLPKDSEVMIGWIDRTYLHTSEFFCPSLIELHMLSWINYAVLKIGDWNYGQPLKNMTRFSDAQAIVRYLNENRMLLNFKASLEDVVRRVNFTKNNYITIEEKLKKDNDHNSIASGTSELAVPLNNLDLTKSSSTSKLVSYEVRKETAGFILIINQRVFHPNIEKPKESLNRRNGTDFDRDRLVKTFSRHGYRERIRENLTDDEILQEVRQVARDSCDKDSLIVCILSHGKLGTIFSSNNVQVPIEKIKFEMATDELKDKPKILIIQACQEASETREIQQHFDTTNYRPEYFQNMFTSHSTIGGFVSYRTRAEGTWFIQTLCKVIEEHGRDHHISDIFTILFREFEEKKGPAGERMVPHVSKTMSKNFYLPY